MQASTMTAADIEHELQVIRQAYCGYLKEAVEEKMEAMAQEAEENRRCEQTFQRWLGDQILKSSDFLTI